MFSQGLCKVMKMKVVHTVVNLSLLYRVSIRGVKSLGGHFACLCRGFDFYEVKKKYIIIIFQKENGSTFTLLIIFKKEIGNPFPLLTII